MDIVDRLYELVKDNNSIDIFNENIDLFREFYYNYMHIDFFGKKVITIYKYLLSIDIPEGHEIMPYVGYNIIQDLNMYEGMTVHAVYSGDFEVNDTYCENLFELIDLVEEFRSLNVKSSLNKLVPRDKFVRDYTGAMIVALNSGLFNLSNEKIFAMSSAIKNNEYLKKTIEEGLDTELMDKDYIFQYATRYLFNAEFIDDEHLEEDQLAKALKESKIKDYALLKKLFTSINDGMLMRFFDDGNLSNALDTIENATEDEQKRKELFNIILSKSVDVSCKASIDFIMHDSRKDKYIDDQKEHRLLECFINHYPENVSPEEINFVVSKMDELSIDTRLLFELNLKTEIEFNRVGKELEEFANKDKESSFNASIAYLIELTKGNHIEEDPKNIAFAIKSIVRKFTGDKVRVLFDRNPDHNGCAYTGETGNTISLNYSLIEKFASTANRDEEPESLHIFETVFHELRHIDQYSKMEKEPMDKDIFDMYKEDAVIETCSNYYNKNYFGISFERDARIYGAHQTSQFLQILFPFMENSIDYFNKREEQERNEQIEDSKKIFELSENRSVDETLSKLISINPSILKRKDKLSREFNIDGSKKNTGMGY